MHMQVLKSHFDRIYCLSLERRPDRWNRVQAMAEKFGLSIKRIISEATDADLQNTTYYNKNVSPLTRIVGMQSMISCSHGHRKIWEDIARHQYSRALIFEDDVIVSDSFCEDTFQQAWQQIPADWDRVYLGHFDVPMAGRLLGRSRHHYNSSVIRPLFPTLAHAYAITGKHANELLEECGKIKWYVDYEMAFNSMKNHQVYAMVPDLMQQYDHADSEQAVSNRNLVLKYILRSKNVEHFYSVNLLRIMKYELTVGGLLVFLTSIVAGLFLAEPLAGLAWVCLSGMIFSLDIFANYPRIFNTLIDISLASLCFMLTQLILRIMSIQIL